MKTSLHNYFFVLSVIGGACFVANIASAQGGVPLWTNRYSGIGNDTAKALAVDTNGNVFVTGYSARTFASSYYDFATIKYSSSGLALWTNRYDGPGNGDDQAVAIAVDQNGNVIVTGYSADISNSAYDYVTIAYSNSGVALWTNRYDGPESGDDEAAAVAVDTDGNVFVTGFSHATSGGNDYATIAYSSAGIPLWTNRYNGLLNTDDSATAIVVNNSGNVFVTGRALEGGGYSFTTIAYSNVGVGLWTNRFSLQGNSFSAGKAIAADQDGNVVVTGYSGSGSSTSYDYATVKYSAAGSPLWTNRYNGSANTTDQATAIAVDSIGNVLVAGYSGGSGSGPDYVTIKYSGSGVPLWTNHYNGPANNVDQATGVAVDADHNVFVTGFSTASGRDYATVAYSSDGVPLWTNRYNAPNNGTDFAAGVAADRSGNIFVTGTSSGTFASDFATIKYGPTVLLKIGRIADQAVLSWANPTFGLQSAPTVTGTFTNVPDATSPHTNSITGAQQFFRLKAN